VGGLRESHSQLDDDDPTGIWLDLAELVAIGV
jgi:hypothetical protein